MDHAQVQQPAKAVHSEEQASVAENAPLETEEKCHADEASREFAGEIKVETVNHCAVH
jgi:hypothetical protein